MSSEDRCVDMQRIIPTARTERVFLTWTIHHSCNYRCSYCFITTGYRDIFKDNLYPGTQKWMDVWDRLYDRYGSCIVKIAGGEPFTYPDFMDLCVHMGRKHFLDFSSNLFWDVDEFVRRMPKNAARIEPSYHPDFCSDRAGFARKCLQLKENGFMGSVHMVGYPPLLDGIIAAKEFFESQGLGAVILPFRGACNDKQYPDAYTDGEKTKLKIAIGMDQPAPAPAAAAAAPHPDEKHRQHLKDVNKRYFDWYVGKENNLKESDLRWCLHGSSYAKIQPNGDVLRCCTPVAPEKRRELLIGNVLDAEFQLLEGAKPCGISPCFCWKPMLLDQDQTWKPLWRFDTYSRPDTEAQPA